MSLQRIGRYEIRGELGHGGMASVFRGYDPSFDREVAIKILPKHLVGNDELRARFEREARAIAALEHPAIVAVYDVGEDEGTPYLVMRYMRGGTLSGRIKAGGLPFPEVARIIRRLAGALDEAHAQGIVHRDLKPGNILFDPNGNAYIADFGIAKIADAATALTASGAMGTPTYMSPEQAAGSPVDHRSDIYSLGVMLYEMLTGETPYTAPTPMAVAVMHMTEPVPNILEKRPDLSPAVQSMISKALAKVPTKRYDTARQLADDVEAMVAGKERLATQDGPAETLDSPGTVALSPKPTPARLFPFLPLTRPARRGVSSPRAGLSSGTLMVLLVFVAVATASALLNYALKLTGAYDPDEIEATLAPTPTSAGTEITATKTPSGPQPVEWRESLGEIETLEVHLTLGSSSLTLSALDEPGVAFDGAFSNEEDVSPPALTFDRRGGVGVLSVEQEVPALFVIGEDTFGDVALRLPPGVPLDLTIASGIGDAVLDLSDLDVRSLALNGPNGPLRVILPRQSNLDISITGTFGAIRMESGGGAAGDLNIRSFTIQEVFSELEIELPVAAPYDITLTTLYGSATFYLPDELAAHFEHAVLSSGADVFATTLNMQNERLLEVSTGVWQTAGYADADNSVSILVTDDFGTFAVTQ